MALSPTTLLLTRAFVNNIRLSVLRCFVPPATRCPTSLPRQPPRKRRLGPRPALSAPPLWHPPGWGDGLSHSSHVSQGGGRVPGRAAPPRRHQGRRHAPAPRGPPRSRRSPLRRRPCRSARLKRAIRAHPCSSVATLPFPCRLPLPFRRRSRRPASIRACPERSRRVHRRLALPSPFPPPPRLFAFSTPRLFASSTLRLLVPLPFPAAGGRQFSHLRLSASGGFIGVHPRPNAPSFLFAPSCDPRRDTSRHAHTPPSPSQPPPSPKSPNPQTAHPPKSAHFALVSSPDRVFHPPPRSTWSILRQNRNRPVTQMTPFQLAY